MSDRKNSGSSPNSYTLNDYQSLTDECIDMLGDDHFPAPQVERPDRRSLLGQRSQTILRTAWFLLLCTLLSANLAVLGFYKAKPDHLTASQAEAELKLTFRDTYSIVAETRKLLDAASAAHSPMDTRFLDQLERYNSSIAVDSNESGFVPDQFSISGRTLFYDPVEH